MNSKKFKPASGEAVRLALLSGHIFVVEATGWTSLPEFAWKHAYANGCISDDMIKNLVAETPKIDVVNEVTQLLVEAIENNDDRVFDKQGYPKLAAIKEALDMQVTHSQMQTAWKQVKVLTEDSIIEEAEEADLDIK